MNSSLWVTPIPPGAQDSAPDTDAGDAPCRTQRIGSGAQPVPYRVAPPPGAPGGFPHVAGYEILGVIGVGGMGIVYKARHRELNRVVALKMLGRESEADRDSRERFRVEAEAVARLQHPNIIQLFDIGTCDRGAGGTQPYMSLEYVDGSNLGRYVGTPQEPKFAATMVEKVARAAGAAHQLGVIHRDLKPANVLLTAAGEPKIADFGLAKQLEPAGDGSGHYQTQAGMVVGTPEYMAPEQVDGKPPTPAVDVYALGVVLYELLTGRVPFKGATLTETLLMARLGEPVPPRRLQPTLPRDLDTICLTCLAKAPDKRYPTAEALADDLARWADGKAIRARPAGRAERAARWARRNPAVAGLVLLSALLFAAGVSAVLWKWREAEASAAAAVRSAEVERWERYRADVRASSIELLLGHNASAAARSLADAPPECRGWEWHALTAALDSTSRVIRVPNQGGTWFAAAARRVLTTGEDGVLRVWDLRDGAAVAAVAPPAGGRIRAVAANGSAVAATGTDRAVTVHRIGGGERTLTGHAADLVAMRFSPDGRRLATSSRDGVVRLWEVATGREVAAYRHPSPLHVHEVSADGRRVVVSTEKRTAVGIWTEGAPALVPFEDGKGFSGGDFSPDGAVYLAGAEYPVNELRLFDAATGKRLATLAGGHTNSVTKAAFSPDGRRLVTGSMDRTACLWDARSGALVHTLRGHQGWVTAAAFSPDGTRVVTGSADKSLRLWTADGELLAVLTGHEKDLHDVAFSSDGRELYSASALDTTVRVWDVPAAERRGLLRGHAGFVYDVAFLPDSRTVVSASWDGTAAVWDTAAGRRTRALAHPTGKVDPNGRPRENNINAVGLSPDGRYAATVTRAEGVWLWDLTDGAAADPVHRWDVRTDDWRVCRLAFSPDGTRLACGTVHGDVRVFDVRSKREVAKLSASDEAVGGVAFSPDGTRLVTAAARLLRVWDTATWAPVADMAGHKDGIHSVAFSRDGHTLASSSADRTVRLWDAGTWREARALHHGVRVFGVAFHPDGTRLAVGCDDASIRLWDVTRGQEVADLRGHESYVHTVAFSPDGTRLVSGSGDKTLRVWDTVPVGKAGR